jgi:hypothetical protein
MNELGVVTNFGVVLAGFLLLVWARNRARRIPRPRPVHIRRR